MEKSASSLLSEVYQPSILNASAVTEVVLYHLESPGPRLVLYHIESPWFF